MCGYVELHYREMLFNGFKSCCLCLYNSLSVPPAFIITLPDLTSDRSDFMSVERSAQVFIGYDSNFAPTFVLLGKGRNLLEDQDFSVWDVSPACRSRGRRLFSRVESRYICTVKRGCGPPLTPIPDCPVLVHLRLF